MFKYGILYITRAINMFCKDMVHVKVSFILESVFVLKLYVMQVGIDSPLFCKELNLR